MATLSVQEGGREVLLDGEGWIYPKLANDATLTAALAGGEGVVKGFPNDFTLLPSVPYSIQQAVSNMDFWDNAAQANDFIVSLDIYATNEALTYPIESALDAVMTGLLFTLDFRESLGDESGKTQHISFRYSRMGVLQSDLV